MAATPEAKVKKKVREIARKHGFLVADNVATVYSRGGRADMTLTIGLVGIEVEVKATSSSDISALQMVEHERRHDGGAIHIFVSADTLSEFEEFLVALKEFSECREMTQQRVEIYRKASRLRVHRERRE